jgi:hypothetical protein
MENENGVLMDKMMMTLVKRYLSTQINEANKRGSMKRGFKMLEFEIIDSCPPTGPYYRG